MIESGELLLLSPASAGMAGNVTRRGIQLQVNLVNSTQLWRVSGNAGLRLGLGLGRLGLVPTPSNY